MSKVVAIMSMSLDGYGADPEDGVAEVFDWYVTSGDVEIHTGGSDPMTFRLRAPSTFAASGPNLAPCSPGNPTVIPGVGVTHLGATRYARRSPSR